MLAESVTRSRAPGLQTVVLSGEAGIGKTTLLGAFATDVRDRHGGAVLYARCDDGAAVPLQPFRSLVGWCVEQVSTALLEAHAARCGGELRRIAPQLAARIDVPDPTSSDDATERYLLFEAVADLLRRIAGRDGLVVMLDDLHWAEPTALALLRHLTRALVDAPVLLIASFRDGAEHLTEELRLVLADLDRDDVQRIALRGFDDADLADLVAIEAGMSAAAVAARLRDESAGNPLYATQLIRHWVESGLIERDVDTVRFSGDRSERTIPPSLRDVVWSRVGALGPETAEVLSAGAVLGIEFDDDLLTALVDVDEATRRPGARCRERVGPAGAGRSGERRDALHARTRRQCAVLGAATAPAPAVARTGGPRAGDSGRRPSAEDGRAARPSLRARRSPARRDALGHAWPAITRSRTWRRAKRRRGTAPRSSTASRSSGRTRSAPTSSCGWARRCTARATRARTPRCRRASSSPRAATRGRCSFGPRCRPTGDSCRSARSRRSSWRSSRRPSRSPTPTTSPRTPGSLPCSRSA